MLRTRLPCLSRARHCNGNLFQLANASLAGRVVHLKKKRFVYYRSDCSTAVLEGRQSTLRPYRTAL